MVDSWPESENLTADERARHEQAMAEVDRALLLGPPPDDEDGTDESDGGSPQPEQPDGRPPGSPAYLDE